MNYEQCTTKYEIRFTKYASRDMRYAIRYTSIENPTLAHFRHFSSLFTNLPAYKAADIYVPIRHLYICREPSTNQLLFMQNKPNFRKAEMNVNIFSQKDYENISDWTLGQNKPNSNPIKANFQKAKMNANSLITKDYRKNDDFAVRKNKANSNPISEKPKMNVNLYVIEDYENETAFRPKKTNPNKPNQSLSWAQSNGPISSKAKMNKKSLAGKSGHTRAGHAWLNKGQMVPCNC